MKQSYRFESFLLSSVDDIPVQLNKRYSPLPFNVIDKSAHLMTSEDLFWPRPMSHIFLLEWSTSKFETNRPRASSFFFFFF